MRSGFFRAVAASFLLTQGPKFRSNSSGAVRILQLQG